MPRVKAAASGSLFMSEAVSRMKRTPRVAMREVQRGTMATPSPSDLARSRYSRRSPGLVPRRIFDTELAARLAGLPRVGLGAVVESLLGYSLQKGHSAADWSTRPLPEEWLIYAALDVEVLVDLRDALAAILDEQGKTE